MRRLRVICSAALLALAATTAQASFALGAASSVRPGGGQLVRRRVALFVEQQQFAQLVVEFEFALELLELVREQQQ